MTSSRPPPTRAAPPPGVDGFRRALNPERADDSSAQEVRTLPVLYDAQGERHRPWRDVAAALESDRFEDWPISGPRTMQWLAKFWARQGASPSQWLDRHLQAHPYQASDRSIHELRCIAEVMEMAGGYDQLNLAGLGSFELLARR